MHRCHISPEEWERPLISLDGDESHHLQDVMRAAPGEEVALFDGLGRESTARICLPPQASAGTRSQSLNLELSAPVTMTERPSPSVTLVQAIPKGKRMDLIVEKTTELGVSRIIPTMTENTVVRFSGKQCLERRDRWQRIGLSACRQCRSAWLPEIDEVTDYRQALCLARDHDLFLVADPRAGLGLDQALGAMGHRIPPDRMVIVIGPEGGLSDDELVQAADAGGRAVSFSTPILRVETAAIFAVGVIAYEPQAAVRRGLEL